MGSVWLAHETGIREIILARFSLGICQHHASAGNYVRVESLHTGASRDAWRAHCKVRNILGSIFPAGWPLRGIFVAWLHSVPAHASHRLLAGFGGVVLPVWVDSPAERRSATPRSSLRPPAPPLPFFA